MHVEIPTADAFPDIGIVVAETVAEAKEKLAALFAAAALLAVDMSIGDASIAAVGGGRLFMIGITFQLAGRNSVPLASVRAEIFRGENPAAIEAERTALYADVPLDTLVLDKISATSNGREFWNLQLLTTPGA